MNTILYTGAYARPGEPGICGVRLGDDGALERITAYCALENPSYLTRGPGGCLYAVSEVGEGGEVWAFRISPDGALTALGGQPVSGGAACHVAINRAGDVLAVSNYFSGIVDLYRLNPDGAIAGRTCVLSHQGSGLNRERQEGPHAHFAAFHPVREDLMLAVDLGCDKVRLYEIDRPSATAQQVGEVCLPPGSGPRHLAFCPGAPDIAYVVCELGLCVYTMWLQGNAGEITGSRPCVPAGFKGVAGAAAIRADAVGMRVYASTRAYNGVTGEDCVACYAIDPATRELGEPCFFHGVAAEPRDIAVINGYLIAACQSGGRLMSFEIDQATGNATRCAGTLEIPGACCVC